MNSSGSTRGVSATKRGIELLQQAKANQRNQRKTPLTYEGIAEEAFTSAKTVQRFFQQENITRENAISICSVLNLDFREIINTPDINQKGSRSTLSLEIPEGQVPIDSPFYVERPPIENDCYAAIQRSGALIRIKAPRQMGKTSLLSRILAFSRQAGGQAIFLSLQEADSELLQNLDSFLYWFCARIATRSKLDEGLEQLQKKWAEQSKSVGSKSKCRDYLQENILTCSKIPLILGLDEVDVLFGIPEIAGDFFGLIRAWHEESKVDPVWQKLRIVIAHSKEVYIPLDMKQSPFNVGLSTELPEFTNEQVINLAVLHGLDFSKEWDDLQDYSPIRELRTMVSGHPYLVRVALYELARERFTVKDFVEVAPTEEGPYQDHLRRHLINLQQNQSLMIAMQTVVQANGPIQVDSSIAFKLKSMGLVKFYKNSVIPLCNLYRVYFRNRLGNI